MKDLCQYPTPVWIAEAIVERYFSNLDSSDLVCEPSCGPGAFLHAVPAHVPAVGIELDATLAGQARCDTGRRIITGDFRTVSLNFTPTAIIGNPPFQAELIDGFLKRAHELLSDGGRAGFILPVHTFQTASRVMRIAQLWSISYELLPRHIYPRLRLPLVFAMFSKDQQRVLVGFAMYAECFDQQKFDREYREAMQSGAGVWRRVVSIALRRLGGEATLSQLYGEIEGHRPTQSQWWREKIRQTLQVYAEFAAVDTGRWRLKVAA